MSRSMRGRFVARRAMSILFCIGAVGCGGGTITDAGHVIGIVTTGPVGAVGFIGTWRRVDQQIVNGVPTPVQTTWTFAGDGTATRTVIFVGSSSSADTLITTGTWTVSGSTLAVSLLPPNSGALTFIWMVNGDTLTLDNLDYTRIG